MKTQPQQGHLPAENAAPTRGCMFAETQPLKGAYGLLISAPKGCVSLLIFCIKGCIRICYYSPYRAWFVCSFFCTTRVFVWCECWSRQTKEYSEIGLHVNAITAVTSAMTPKQAAN